MWAEKYGRPDPMFVACPVCLANPREHCRGAISSGFHRDRVANAIHARDSARHIGAGTPRR